MDRTKWPQKLHVTNTQPNPPAPTVERKTRPEKNQALNCPRCNSLNTKFCYYNNYSLTQPRYSCKDCKRYWTEGGSLRNIPIGGGVRKKNKKISSSPSSSKKSLFVNTPSLPQLNHKIGDNAHDAAAAKAHDFGTAHEIKDLNLAFSQKGFEIDNHHSFHELLQVLPSSIKNINSLVSTSSALELLGISNSPTSSSNSRPAPNVHDSLVYTEISRFGLSYPQFQEFMIPASGFSPDGGYDGEEVSIGTNIPKNGRSLLPFESLKLPVSSSNTNSGGNGNDHHS